MQVFFKEIDPNTKGWPREFEAYVDEAPLLDDEFCFDFGALEPFTAEQMTSFGMPKINYIEGAVTKRRFHYCDGNKHQSTATIFIEYTLIEISYNKD